MPRTIFPNNNINNKNKKKQKSFFEKKNQLTNVPKNHKETKMFLVARLNESFYPQKQAKIARYAFSLFTCLLYSLFSKNVSLSPPK